jgi:hypothetical protein
VRHHATPASSKSSSALTCSSCDIALPWQQQQPIARRAAAVRDPELLLLPQLTQPELPLCSVPNGATAPDTHGRSSSSVLRSATKHHVFARVGKSAFRVGIRTPIPTSVAALFLHEVFRDPKTQDPGPNLGSGTEDPKTRGQIGPFSFRSGSESTVIPTRSESLAFRTQVGGRGGGW